MVGCSGAQINLSVKSAIRFPANDCLERDIAELQSKTWRLERKRVAGAKSGRNTRIVAVLHPMEPGITAGGRCRAAASQWGLGRIADECRTNEGA
jgi:hypothetical protein